MAYGMGIAAHFAVGGKALTKCARNRVIANTWSRMLASSSTSAFCADSVGIAAHFRKQLVVPDEQLFVSLQWA